MLNVYNHWDKLKTCIVGRTYGPDFYSFVKDPAVRKSMCVIAEQTEEDLANLCNQLRKFDVTVIRPSVTDNYLDVKYGKKILPAPLTPRDYTAVIDDKVFMPTPNANELWNTLRGEDWPEVPPVDLLRNGTISGYDNFSIEDLFYLDHTWLTELESLARKLGNQIIYDHNVDSAMVQRIGDDLYVGNWKPGDPWVTDKLATLFPNKQVTLIESHGHLDGRLCIVSPDLIITGSNIKVNHIFPNHEIFTVRQTAVKEFGKAKAASIGKWWIPEQLSSSGFQNYIETYLSNWVGEVQESCFDVNMLIVDPRNVFCSTEDPRLFRVLESHGITPHVVPYRHKMFWDGGLHCVTSDLDRTPV